MRVWEKKRERQRDRHRERQGKEGKKLIERKIKEGRKRKKRERMKKKKKCVAVIPKREEGTTSQGMSVASRS